MKILTIAIPAYNIADYIDRIMLSIINGDVLESVEVIIVNDGSKDDTINIANSYKEKYPKSVRIIDKENGGHGSTINAAIEAATGKYFRPVDGDDEVFSSNMKEIIKILSDLDTDAVITDVDIVNLSNGDEIVLKYDDIFPPMIEIDFYEYSHKLKQALPYHSITYRTEVFRECGYRLAEHCFYVDSEYSIFPFSNVNKCVYLPKILYKYYEGIPGQSMSVYNRIKHIDDMKKVSDEMIAYYLEIKKNKPEKLSYAFMGLMWICKDYLDIILEICKPNRRTKMRWEETWEYYEKSIPEFLEEYRQDKHNGDEQARFFNIYSYIVDHPKNYFFYSLLKRIRLIYMGIKGAMDD